MSQEYIEITEKTLEEAITTACRKLSVTSDRLDYVVIQREKSGFLGIGAKPAIIKARAKVSAQTAQAILDDVISKAEKRIQKENTVKDSMKEKALKDKTPKESVSKTETEKASADAKKKAEKKAEKIEKAVKSENKEKEKAEKTEQKDREKEAKKNNKKKNKKAASQKKTSQEADPAVKNATEAAAAVEKDAESEAPAPKKKAAVPQLTDEKIAEIKKTANTFLTDVFKAMDMDVEISEDYQKETGVLTVNMEGEDMGVLIGKRGQTLDSLQYLVSLVVNKGVDGYIHVKADTENYRERRKKTLENLAKNIAFKVKRTRQPVALEPMNPYERRIIHSSLQNEKYITTYSEGEEPYRKVVVALKKDENGVDLLKEERFEKGGRGRNSRNGKGGRGGRRGRDYRGSKNSSRSSDNTSDHSQNADAE